ncbi:hypothetical protein [Oxynema aestuarii]|jgi:hypothetical protein|nr:hypothetical protein [Oxynema aestuarii]
MKQTTLLWSSSLSFADPIAARAIAIVGSLDTARREPVVGENRW